MKPYPSNRKGIGKAVVPDLGEASLPEFRNGEPCSSHGGSDTFRQSYVLYELRAEWQMVYSVKGDWTNTEYYIP